MNTALPPVTDDASNDPYTTEGALLAGLLAGDSRAHHALVTQYTPYLFRVLANYLRNPEDVADVCQDTLFEVTQRIHRFERRSTLRYWVRGIGVNQALMRLRQQRRRAEVSLDELTDPSGPPCAAVTRLLSSISVTDDRAERSDLDAQVRHAIDDLPNQYRDIVMLRDLHGHSTQEAADILGIRPTSARVRLYRARRALQDSLDGVVERQDLCA